MPAFAGMTVVGLTTVEDSQLLKNSKYVIISSETPQVSCNAMIILKFFKQAGIFGHCNNDIAP